MRILVLGAGIIGLSVAEELMQRGHTVNVVDPAPGMGASHAAAGMLSPSSEVWHGEEEILRLGLRSMLLWPSYAARWGVRLAPGGTLLVAQGRGDLQQIERQVALLGDYGTAPPLLSGREVRHLEPTLNPRVAGGALLPDDLSVDPRAVVAALLTRIDVTPGASGSFDATVLATGAQLPPPFAHLVRGVRGEILRGRTDDPPAQTVRGFVHGQQVYVVPRADGGLVVGATTEEHDAPPLVTCGGVFALLEAARTLFPGLDRAEFGGAIARDRPATPDNLPLVGPLSPNGPVLAAGLFRHGVLLAPLIAQLVAGCVEGAAPEPALDPRRFAESARIDSPRKENR